MGSGVRFHGEKDESQIIMGPSADAALTIVGAAIGTPSYMAPEAARAKEVDIRTDLYGVGATLYHMLTGVLPFKGANAEETMKLLVTAPVPDPRKINSSVSAPTAELVIKLMQKDPSRRLQSPDELVEQVEDLLKSPDAVKTSNSSLPRARRGAAKSLPKTLKAAPETGNIRQIAIACAIAFVLGGTGIWLLMRNGRGNGSGEKEVAENGAPVLPVPPVAPTKPEGEKVGDPKHDPAVPVSTEPPPKTVETAGATGSRSEIDRRAGF